MTNYDIIMVEDDIAIRYHVAVGMKSNSLTFMSVSSLKSLEDALKDDNARLFVVDGSFPPCDGSYEVMYLAPQAIDLIRKCNPDAKIVLHTLARDAEEKAKELKVKYVSKFSKLDQRIAEFKKIMGRDQTSQ